MVKIGISAQMQIVCQEKSDFPGEPLSHRPCGVVCASICCEFNTNSTVIETLLLLLL